MDQIALIATGTISIIVIICFFILVSHVGKIKAILTIDYESEYLKALNFGTPQEQKTALINLVWHKFKTKDEASSVEYFLKSLKEKYEPHFKALNMQFPNHIQNHL